MNYQVVDSVKCQIIGLKAIIRQAKHFGGEEEYGHLPFNLCIIPILSAIYEGMITEIVIAKFEVIPTPTSDTIKSRKKVEFNGSLSELKKLYKRLFHSDLFDVVESQKRDGVCRSLNAMVALRNKFAHGAFLIYPEEAIPEEINGGFVKDWQEELNKTSNYFKEKYDSSHVIDVLKNHDVCADFVIQLQILAKGLQSKHNDLGIKSLGPILEYKYGYSN